MHMFSINDTYDTNIYYQIVVCFVSDILRNFTLNDETIMIIIDRTFERRTFN